MLPHHVIVFTFFFFEKRPLRDRSGRHSRDAAKRGCASGSRPWVRSRRRPPSDVDGIPQSTTEAIAGTGGWRTRLRSPTEGWSPRLVWTWRVRLERRTEAWTERDSMGAHAELHAQVQSHTSEARDQRRGGRHRDRYITIAESYRSRS